MHASSGKIASFAFACALILTFISPIVSQAPALLTAIGTNSLGVSCQAYCVGIKGAPYSNSIPRMWAGAYCVNASRLTAGGVPYTQVPCTTAVAGPTLQCTCAPSSQGPNGAGLGWNMVNYASEGEHLFMADYPAVGK
jgi:hypothetical protein